MIVATQWRQKSLLNTSEWRTSSLGSIHDFEQQLFDYGLDIAELLEKIDNARLGPLSGNGFTDSEGFSFLCCTLSVIPSLLGWYQRLVAFSSEPLFWSGPNLVAVGRPMIIITGGLDRQRMTTTYWTLLLVASNDFAILCNEIQPWHPSYVRDLDFFSELGYVIMNGYDESFYSVNWQDEARRYGLNYQLDLADLVIQSIPYFFEAKHGMTANQQCLYAVRMTVVHLRRLPGPRAAQLCYEAEQLLRYLGSVKMLNYAKALWSPLPGRDEPDPGP
ncbi:hypothetical protein MMC13_006604 [Lambiella insularis]|nr:hypothetical protein [Lambiella insularis]